MKLIVVLCTILAVSQALSYSELVRQEWNTFKLQHRKKYTSPREDEHRMQIFMETRNKIAKHNEAFERGEVTYKMGLNKFADMTNEEFINTMTGYRPNKLVRSRGLNYTRQNNVRLPSSVDWRQQGAVTSVKNQGQCGSCWAFSATGSIEGQHFRKTGKLVSLSEQNLMDCATNYPNDGCNGGDMMAAFDYVIDNGGIDTEDSYPYEERDGRCRYKAQNIGATISDYVALSSGDQAALKEAVANVGPVSVAMYASLNSFGYYESGVYYDAACSGEYYYLNHGVLVVGYGTEDGSDYWIVKNSWGDDWGESGYFRISTKNNNCGIATEPTYPIV
ncbi:cathepsin L [Anabrus simplex]|uniref:cathepsin L n=1 Tax=Anabrus simplex TaxID=316456 RepID=UPI0035A2763A